MTGYTDGTGTHENNNRIAFKRAEAVVEFLVARNIDEGQMQIRTIVPEQAGRLNRQLRRAAAILAPRCLLDPDQIDRSLAVRARPHHPVKRYGRFDRHRPYNRVK